MIKKFNNVVIELDSERIKQLVASRNARRCMSVAHTTFFLINKLIKKKASSPCSLISLAKAKHHRVGFSPTQQPPHKSNMIMS